MGDHLSDEEFEELRQFMEITPSGQISYERKKGENFGRDYFNFYIEFIHNICQA